MNFGRLWTGFLMLRLAKTSRVILLLGLLGGSLQAQAQTPIGLYEGFMGNAGVASSESMAPSFYNPSLLMYKNKGTYNVSANTFESSQVTEGDSEIESTSFVPGYLSGIFVGESFNHEFFMVGLTPMRAQFSSEIVGPSNRTLTDGQADLTTLRMGYTMAAKSFPLAFGYFANYYQSDTYSNSEVYDGSNNLSNVSKAKGQNKSLAIGFSISSHVKWGNYTFGYQYKTRTLEIFNSSSGQAETFLPDTSSTLTKVNASFDPEGSASSGEEWVIGHGFKLDSVELLTDTFFEEKDSLNHSYRVYQSFGIRVFSKTGHQYLFGFKQELGDQIDYIGESTYISTGYSWKTRTSRSAIGIYKYTDNVDSNYSKIGFSFASEIVY